MSKKFSKTQIEAAEHTVEYFVKRYGIVGTMKWISKSKKYKDLFYSILRSYYI